MDKEISKMFLWIAVIVIAGLGLGALISYIGAAEIANVLNQVGDE